jgi:outer membrane protein, multidrug efflux system
MKKVGLIICMTITLSACMVSPQPMSVEQRYSLARKDIHNLFVNTPEPVIKLTLSRAMAFGIKYNLDYRIRQANAALESGQLRLAQLIMFPSLTTTGSLYKRSNDLISSGVSNNGQPTSLVSSTPRFIRSSRVAFSWNVLDFGISYLKAKEQGEKALIAREEARKQAQQLSQDILVAYWHAYSAQQLLKKTVLFQALLNKSKTLIEMALLDKTIPKENLLNYQAALLDGSRQLFQLQQKYDKAILDLKKLTNLQIDARLVLAPPPINLRRVQKFSDIDFKKIDAISLVNRPELKGQNYQAKIAKYGIAKAVLSVIPGPTLNYGWNYTSNKFLLNAKWMDKSFELAWNLLNLAAFPTAYYNAKEIYKLELLKRMAITFAVLTETRYAYSIYQNISKEYVIAHQQTNNAKKLFELMSNRQKAFIANPQQVIMANLKLITSQMNEDLMLSDMSTALGEFYLSLGIDLIPRNLQLLSLPEISRQVEKNLAFQQTVDLKTYVNYRYDKLFTQKSIRKS